MISAESTAAVEVACVEAERLVLPHDHMIDAIVRARSVSRL